MALPSVDEPCAIPPSVEPCAERRWGRRSCCQPHVFWTLPLWFLSYATTLGPLSVYQGLAHQLYGHDAELAFNIPLAIQAVIAIVVAPIIGRLSDHYGRKPLLLFSTTLYVLPYLCLCIFDLSGSRSAYMVFMALQSLSGLGGAHTVIVALAFTYITDCVLPERRSAVSGLMVGLGAGPAIVAAPMFFAWAYQDGAAFDRFKVILAGCLCSEIAYIAMMPESNPPARRVGQQRPGMRDMNPLKSFRLFRAGVLTPQQAQHMRTLSLVLLMLYTMKGALTWSLGLYAEQVFGFTTEQRSAMQSIYGLGQSVGQLSIKFLLARWSSRRAVNLSVTAGVIACAIPAAPRGWLDHRWLYVSEAMLSLAFVAHTVCCALATQIVPRGLEGEAAQLVNAAITLCGGMGPLIFGVLVQAFLLTSYHGGALLILTFVVFCSLVMSFKLPSDEEIEDMQKGVPAHATSCLVEEAG